MQWLGLRLSDFDRPPVIVWPENRCAVRVFLAMGTQWRVGMSGCTGLDYGVLSEIWRRLKVAPGDRDSVFGDLRVLEVAALNEMHKKD